MTKVIIKRIPFLMKMTPETHSKMKLESERAGLSMSGFIAMLITKYDKTDVKFFNK